MKNAPPTMIIVNDNDQQIAARPRIELQAGDMFRVSEVWVLSTDLNHVLLSQRATTKRFSPGKWASSAAGTRHPEDNDTYLSNAILKTEEELG